MRIHTYLSYEWSDGTYVLVSEKGYDWTGHVALCKGASAAQTQLQQSQSNFYNTLTSDYGAQFASQNAILSSLTNSLQPILQAGPNQFGFSTGETNALNSQAVQGTGTQYQNAQKALQEQQSTVGGGNQYLPSGANQQQTAELATNAANQESNQLLGIQQAGYNAGRQNYQTALSTLNGVASQYNPTGYAGSANNAGSTAFNSATEVNKENQAASPWNIVGGILGSAANIGLGIATGGASMAVPGILGSLSGGMTGGNYAPTPSGSTGGFLPSGSFGGDSLPQW